jgi:hypothetical protein
MLRSCFAAAGVIAAAFLFGVGCGSDVEDPADPQQDGTEVGQPPKAGPEKSGDGAGVVLAVNKLFVGETGPDGTASNTAWRQYGFNVDGKVSTTASQDLCKPADGAKPADVYQDGDDGIDNSFGKNVLPILLALVPNPSAEASNAIASGDFTVILKIDGLGEETSYNPLITKLYGGASLGRAPAWDGNDEWPVVPELLSQAGDIESSTVVFPKSYLVDNTWVSGTKGAFTLNLSIAGNNISLSVSGATISLDLDADHKGGINGTISGVLETELLIQELQNVIGAIDANLCQGAALETIILSIRRASDILKNGSQDPSKACDAISIGLGFTAKQVQLGAIAPETPPAENPCMDTAEGG